MNYPIPDKLYQILKWTALVILPAVAVFYGKVGPGWGWPEVENVVETLTQLGLLIGAVIGASQVAAMIGSNQNGNDKDGE